jgi:hypothetical protein
MAAFDKFRAFNKVLTDEQRQQIQSVLDTHWQELLAARSEEARGRIVQAYQKIVREQLR